MGLVDYSITADDVDENIVTRVYDCLHRIKNKRNRSVKEMEKAAYTIGLLVMITRDDDKAHEVYEDVFSAVSQGLNSKLDTAKVIELLAVVTFFGTSDSYETEQAMQFIWTFIHPQSGFDSSSTVLTAAISAWSILLSAITGWNASCKLWKEATSHFSNLLNNNDVTVCEAAFEALALIHETNVPEKFLTFVKDSHVSVHENAKKELQNVIKQVRSRFPYLDSHPQRKLLTCSQIIQMKYMINFLGKDGFAKHMNKNEKFHNLFNFTPETSNSSENMLSTPEREEVKVIFYQPNVPVKRECGSNNHRQLHKKMTKSNNSSLSKARTRLLKKKRTVLAQERGEDPWVQEESY